MCDGVSVKRSTNGRRLVASTEILWYAVITGLLFCTVLAAFAPFASIAIWRTAPFSTAGVLMIAGICVVSACGRWAVLPQMRTPVYTPPEPGLRVAVVTAFVASSEPLAMLEQSLRAFVNLDYPHDCWVLDEEDSAAVRELCSELNVQHFSRLHRPEYQADSGQFQSRSKHGNYNAWLSEVGFGRYDVITAFDVDHVPAPHFLSSVLGYLRDPKIGYVQAPQAYYNSASSFVARGAAEETYDFYSTIQMASYALGYTILIGSHNTHRMDALADVGGFAAHDADDLLLTLLYRQKGWEGVYVPKILARGTTPVDWNSYLTQQRRWARSVVDLKFRYQRRSLQNLPLFTQVMSYLQGTMYLQPALVGVLWLILLIQCLGTGRYPAVLSETGGARFLLLGLTLLVCYLYRQRFFLDPLKESGVHLRARILRVAKAPFMLQGILDVVRGRRFDYVMTLKTASTVITKKKLLPVFGPVAVALTTAWAVGVLSNPDYPVVLHTMFAAAFGFCVGLLLDERRATKPAFDEELLRTEWTSSPEYLHRSKTFGKSLPKRDSFMGIPVLTVDLRRELADIVDLGNAREAHVLICLNGRPLCRTRLPVKGGRVTAAQVWTAAESLAGESLVQRILERALEIKEEPATLPPCSVVICTKDRPDDVRRCLAALAPAIREGTEVILVDNDPSDDRTRTIANEYNVVYFRQARRGVNWARARGARLASNEIVLYVDDDVVVSPNWVDEMRRPFIDPHVGAVTGAVEPLELETQGQELHERFSSFYRGFRQIRYDLTTISPASAGRVGAGASLGIRKDLAIRYKAFDAELDGGTEARSGGDVYGLYRILHAGYAVVYHPEALAWHRHRKTNHDLERMLYGYSVGGYCVLLAAFQRERDWDAICIGISWFYHYYLQELKKYVFRRPEARPGSVLWAEFKGIFDSPGAYSRCLEQEKHLGPLFPEGG